MVKSTALHTALSQKVIRPVIFIELDHPDGMVRVFSGSGELQWDSHTWLGPGEFGSVSQPSETSDIQSNDITFSLTGTDPSFAETAKADVRHRPAQMWYATIDDNGNVVAPTLIWWGEMDYSTFVITDKGDFRIDIVAHSFLRNIKSSPNIFWTSQEQERRVSLMTTAGTDTGFDYVPTLQDKVTKWPNFT